MSQQIPVQQMAQVAPVAGIMQPPVMAPVAPVTPEAPMMQPPVMAPVAPVAPVAPEAPTMQPPVMAPVAPEAPTMQPPVMAPVQNEVLIQEAPILAPTPEAPVQEALETPEPLLEEPALIQMDTPALENSTQEQLVVPDLPPVQNSEFGVAQVMDGALDLNGLSPEDTVKLEEANKKVEPISIGGLISIGTINVAGFGGFLKVLEHITKDLNQDDVVCIENGMLDTIKDGIFLHADLRNVLGDISLTISAPHQATKMLKIIRGGELIQIFKDEINGVYHFCNILNNRILTRVKIRFATEGMDAFSKAPTLPGNPFIKEIGAQEQETIRTIIAGKAAMGNEEPYRFGYAKDNNTLVSIGVGNEFTYFFQDSGIASDEFKVYYPFPVNNLDSAIIKLYKFVNETTGQEENWIQTVNNFEFVSIVCTEKVEIFNAAIEDFSF